jgi:unsaturated pyranuronate lyase
MRLLDYATMVPREIAPGFLGRFVHSDRLTQGRIDIEQGATIPEHSHPHEQWTMVLTGRLELTVDGAPHVLLPGQVMYIPPHERHAARGLTRCQVLDTFQPPRDDFR